jgi:SP family general alpha glucoside:H+ symporter-like MFS transporter
MEKAVCAGTTYWDCFRGTNFRRTEIACMVWMTQQFCGAPFMGFSTYFLEQAGLSTNVAFDMTIAQFSIGFIGTISSWFMMSYIGRRTLYLAGDAAMTLVLLLIGILGAVGATSSGTSWAVGGLLLCFTFIYDSTVGPACYSIVAEIPSTRLRAKTVVLARSCFNLAAIVTNIIQPRLINPNAWGLGAKAGFVWMVTCFLFLIWTYFRLPEPKGRTYGELDVLFERKVPARKFKSTPVQEFAHLNQASSWSDSAQNVLLYSNNIEKSTSNASKSDKSPSLKT